jgi:hypothetical protein
MKIQFTPKDNGPDRLVAEAELLFDDGLLEGMKLVGFSLWKSPEGEIYVTFPSRAFGAGADRRYFDFLRSTEGTPLEPRRLKAAILEAFQAQAQATGAIEPEDTPF